MEYGPRAILHSRPPMMSSMTSAAISENRSTDTPRVEYLLRHGVYVAEVGRKAIFLDLNTDRYQAIDRALFRSLPLAGCNEDQTTSFGTHRDDVVNKLVAKGLLTNEAHAGQPVRQAARPAATRHLIPDGKAIGRVERALTCVRLLHIAAVSDRMLKRKSLKSCIQELQIEKAACRTSATLPPWLSYFLHARFYYPADSICLRDSFLTMNMLVRAGIAADWVFAVQADPFKAHCWVQVGDTVINDNVETVARFTPILVV
jgi:hypothetical protein